VSEKYTLQELLDMALALEVSTTYWIVLAVIVLLMASWVVGGLFKD